MEAYVYPTYPCAWLSPCHYLSRAPLLSLGRSSASAWGGRRVAVLSINQAKLISLCWPITTEKLLLAKYDPGVTGIVHRVRGELVVGGARVGWEELLPGGADDVGWHWGIDTVHGFLVLGQHLNSNLQHLLTLHHILTFAFRISFSTHFLSWHYL